MSEAAPISRCNGLIDTGASVVCIDQRIAERLGLEQVDEDFIQPVGGAPILVKIYMGMLRVPVLGFSEIVRLYGARIKGGHHDVLLGRSFLKNFIVTFDGPAGMFHFFPPFRFPGPEPDDDFAT